MVSSYPNFPTIPRADASCPENVHQWISSWYPGIDIQIPGEVFEMSPAEFSSLTNPSCGQAVAWTDVPRAIKSINEVTRGPYKYWSFRTLWLLGPTVLGLPFLKEHLSTWGSSILFTHGRAAVFWPFRAEFPDPVAWGHLEVYFSGKTSLLNRLKGWDKEIYQVESRWPAQLPCIGLSWPLTFHHLLWVASNLLSPRFPKQHKICQLPWVQYRSKMKAIGTDYDDQDRLHSQKLT